MKQYQRKIEEYKSLIQKEYIRETAVDTVKERSWNLKTTKVKPL